MVTIKNFKRDVKVTISFNLDHTFIYPEGIAAQIGLSPSRVTRIVQSSLNTVREYLNAHEQYGY